MMSPRHIPIIILSTVCPRDVRSPQPCDLRLPRDESIQFCQQRSLAEEHMITTTIFFYIYLFNYTPFSPQFSGIQLVVTVLSHRCNFRTYSGEAKVESCASSETQPSEATLLKLEASRTNVSEETPYTWRPCRRALRRKKPQELLVRDGTKTSLLAKPSPNPDDAGPIVPRPMGLPVVSGCDRSWT